MSDKSEPVRIRFTHSREAWSIKAKSIPEFNQKLAALGIPSSCFVPDFSGDAPPKPAEPKETP